MWKSRLENTLIAECAVIDSPKAVEAIEAITGDLLRLQMLLQVGNVYREIRGGVRQPAVTP